MAHLFGLIPFVVTAALPHEPAAQREHLPTPMVEIGKNEVRLPLTFSGGRPVVEVRLNGKGPYRFYFDTGASGPVMSQRVSKELGLKVIGVAGVKSGGDGPEAKPIQADIVDLHTIDFGSVKLLSVRMVAMDRAKLGGEDAPVGVLSPAMFRGHLENQGCLVAVDYARKELRIRPGALPQPDNKTVFAYQPGMPIPSLKVRIAEQEIETHLDAGSGDWFTLPNRFGDTLPLEGKAVDTKQKAGSVSGQFPVREGKLKGSLAFGKFSYKNPTLRFSDVVRTGNIGSKLLERFVVTVDAKNRRFQLEQIAAN
jgi:hypothetical protein